MFGSRDYELEYANENNIYIYTIIPCLEIYNNIEYIIIFSSSQKPVCVTAIIHWSLILMYYRATINISGQSPSSQLPK